MREQVRQRDAKQIQRYEVRSARLDHEMLAHGGLCKTKEDHDQLRKNGTCKVLKAQLKFRKKFLNRKHLRITGSTKTLYSTLLFLRDIIIKATKDASLKLLSQRMKLKVKVG